MASYTEVTTTASEPPVIRAKGALPDIKEIRDAIPPHCFQPSAIRSLAYVARDLAMAGGLAWAALTFIPNQPDYWTRVTLWTIYGFLQGLVGVGIWILGHECGHGAFSLHRRLNDCCGWFLHSILLVPFFSWKFSHARHHRFTGNMQKDMAFVPSTRSQWAETYAKFGMPDPELFADTPLFNLVTLTFHQLVGWQAYLFLNVSAGEKSLQPEKSVSWWRRSHFDPFSAVFRPTEAMYVAISVLGMAMVGCGLWAGAQQVGWATIGLLYGIPYLWVHHWLVAITYLHHHHEDVHHYQDEHWSFVAGALGTIDRDFGFIDRHIFHGIIGTHVVHHLFSRIPFYYAEEATDAIRPMLGDLYVSDDRSFMGQLWNVWNNCKYVEEDPQKPGVMKWAKRDQKAMKKQL